MATTKMMKSFAIVIFFLIVVFSFLNYAPSGVDLASPESIKYVRLGESKVEVELARSAEEQQLGLSGREGLGASRGMLFVFENSFEHYFWMKDMKFAIDIIWIDENLEIIYIKKGAEQQSEKQLETYGPRENSKYVLEVESGFSDKNNIKVGDRVRLSL